eukprot:CAMPEP_0182416366 /NCGR_PEP_ID=MMETSP1167-20130531/644_1 /TAXON_ID=2988 /ORGANISM="Mallomonas Sp, Strain CCMP3275" /LENGTH=258 /DNA_ID=CAMNT_0024589065 /DNA_START=61 /DNA_END=837 /DNA_ORIENTATION=-
MTTFISPDSTTIPTSLGDEHRPVVVSFRPPGIDAAPKELRYFCLRGLAEVPRLMLEVTSTPYDCIMYFSGENNYKSISPTGAMPIYTGPELNGEYIAQSGAIVRHIARETGFDGETVLDKAITDQVYETSKDISSNRASIFEEDQTKLKGLLSRSEDMLKGPYFLGEKISFGDVAMFYELSRIEEAKPGWLTTKGFTKLSSFLSQMIALPAISDYLQSPRRIPITENEVGDKPWARTGYKFMFPLNPETVAKTLLPEP